MTLIHIGATASDNSAPCYSPDAWGELLAALARGDDEAIIAITTTTKPTYVATASLKTVEPASMVEAAQQYWAKRGKTPKARYAGPDGTPIVVSVPR